MSDNWGWVIAVVLIFAIFGGCTMHANQCAVDLLKAGVPTEKVDQVLFR